MTTIIPVKNLTTQDVLYGDRQTSYRWEVLSHPPVRSNLLQNPSGRASTAGYVAVGAGATLGQDLNADTYAITTTGGTPAGSMGVKIQDLVVGVDLQPNTTYTFTASIQFSINFVQQSPMLAAINTGVVANSVTAFPASPFTRRTITFTTAASGIVSVYVLNNVVTSSGVSNIAAFKDAVVELSSTYDANVPYFDGSSSANTYWAGSANASISYLVTPDQLLGVLDGVSSGSLTWNQNAAVKGGGNAEIIDLDVAQAGLLRIADLKLETARLRPVCTIQGLPDNPLGVFLMSAAEEDWDDTGRTWSVELLDKCTVPSQDSFEYAYSVAAGTNILQAVRNILASCGEGITIDSSVTLATSTGMAWDAGVSKLKIINDLLDVAGYNSLWMDGSGNFQATPRVLPANRSTTYETLNIPRELQDGAQSIYAPKWNREKDSFSVPNKVIAVQAADGASGLPALVGTWTNTDPLSPYSYPSRGRWVPYVLDSVECPAGTTAEITAFLQNRARATLIQMSAVQATVKIEHLPIPLRVGDAIQFGNTKAGINTKHIVTRIELKLTSLGTMRSTLQEVISL